MLPVDALIPAAPGTYLLLPRLNADQFEAVQVVVVGWAATSAGVVPVTVAGMKDGQEGGVAVLQPDGRVEEMSGEVYPNQDEWKRVTVRRLRAAQR